MVKDKTEVKEHYTECRCKGKNKNCQFCGGTNKFLQGYYLITKGMGFYIDTLK